MAAGSKRKAREEEKSSGGLPITARFALSMALALTLVMSAAGFLLYQSAVRVTRNVQQTTLVDAVAAGCDDLMACATTAGCPLPFAELARTDLSVS